ncbi:DNA recombination and repair protein RecO [Cutibacterium acnes JCM 18916]|nr:DNA recombination and repair protein RecO [Cutibacterium acnes JCM 18916]
MPTYRDQAVVLRTHKLGEADRIVSMLSREHGKIRAVARGIRRTSSKFGARLDPFNLVDLQLVQGRNLDVVAQVECLHPYSAPLRQDYSLFTAAEVMVEAADHLVPVDREPAPAQYRLLAGALRVLGQGTTDGPRPPEMVLDSYLLRSLSASGYAPDLVDCVRCGTPGPHQGFFAQFGGAWCVLIVSRPELLIRTRRRFRTCGLCWWGTGLRRVMLRGRGFGRGPDWWQHLCLGIWIVVCGQCPFWSVDRKSVALRAPSAYGAQP